MMKKNKKTRGNEDVNEQKNPTKQTEDSVAILFSTFTYSGQRNLRWSK